MEWQLRRMLFTGRNGLCSHLGRMSVGRHAAPFGLDRIRGVRADYIRFMSVAMQAAPKPLSIFTTQTLGEQVLSMPSKAARPPKLAP